MLTARDILPDYNVAVNTKRAICLLFDYQTSTHVHGYKISPQIGKYLIVLGLKVLLFLGGKMAKFLSAGSQTTGFNCSHKFN